MDLALSSRLTLAQRARSVSVYECQRRYGAGVGWVASTSVDEWPPWAIDGEGQGPLIAVPSITDSPNLSPAYFDRTIKRDQRRMWKWEPTQDWKTEVLTDLTDAEGWRYGISGDIGVDPEIYGLLPEETRKTDMRRRLWTRRAIADPV